MPEEYDEHDEHLERPPSFFPYSTEPEEVDTTPVEVSVEGVYQSETGPQTHRYVMLTDDEGRQLTILIGIFEATAISLALEGQQSDRPQTHDLLRIVTEKLGGTVTKVVIDDIWTTTYYAKIHVSQGEQDFEIDSRPSDAIAIALRCGVPIFVSPQVMEQGSDEE